VLATDGSDILHQFFDDAAFRALVQLNGDIFLFYNKSLGDLNVEKFTPQHSRKVDGVDDVWHAYPLRPGISTT
jgi:hypothetical protein